MKVLNLGSLNIDFNYSLGHIMQTNETQAAHDMHTFPGGKGLNQSIAMARAGMEVHHAGFIGEDGDFLVETLNHAGVYTELIHKEEGRSGHAIIQVDPMGQNAVMIYGGCNTEITTEYIDSVLEQFDEEDVLVLQNEISNVPYAMERAHEKKMKIILNPSPCNEGLKACDLTKVDLFFINEVEGRELTSYVQPGDILIGMQEQYPNSSCVLTLGKEGAFFKNAQESLYQKALPVHAVDSTAAGDIFEGYFLASYLNGHSAKEALKIASYAAGISVQRKGASMSAPTMEETLAMIAKE